MNYKLRVTPEQSRQVQEIAFKHGLHWGRGIRTAAYCSYPYLYLSIDSLTYGSIGSRFRDWPHPEISAEDFIKKYGDNIMSEFTKSDLKTGMVCQHRDGRHSLVVKDTYEGEDNVVFHSSSRTGLNNFDEDTLKSKKDYKRLDIVKVFKPRNVCNGFTIFEEDQVPIPSMLGKLIWESDSLKVTKVSVEDVGPYSRTISIYKENPRIIEIGCSSYTKVEAYEAIINKYSDKPTLMGSYLNKVIECFEKAEKAFKED